MRTGTSISTSAKKVGLTHKRPTAEDQSSQFISLLTSEVKKMIWTLYDSSLACDLYQHDCDSDLIFYFLAPVLRIVLLRCIFGLDEEARESLITDAMAPLFINIVERRYNPDTWDDNHFTNFFYMVIKRQYFETLNSDKRFERPPVAMLPSRLIHPQDVINHIYLGQIPGIVREEVSKGFRFQGRDLLACMYVLDRLLTGSQVVTSYMKRTFTINDPNFIISYVLVRIRGTIYQMKIKGGRYVFGDIFANMYLVDDGSL